VILRWGLLPQFERVVAGAGEEGGGVTSVAELGEALSVFRTVGAAFDGDDTPRSGPVRLA